MSNQLVRKPKLTTEEKLNKYKNLGLRENPFPIEPGLVIGSDDPRLNGDIYCEFTHEDKQKDFLSLLVPSLSRSESSSIAFLMDYATRRGRGIGKTAFIGHQQKFINADFGDKASEGTGVFFASHIIPTTSPPCRKFWEFCRLILNTLDEQGVIKKAIWRLRALSGVIQAEVLNEIEKLENWEETIGNEKWLEKNKVSLFELNNKVEKMLIANGVKHDFAKRISHNDYRFMYKMDFSYYYSDYQWRKEGGKLIFDDLVKFFLAAQFSRGLLLIDEVEKIVYHQNTQERRAFVESLRYYMLDGDCASARKRFYGMLLTIHPGIQEILLSHWKAAGLDRLAPLHQPDAKESTIYFGPLDEKTAIPLVEEYLKYYRFPGKRDQYLEPFDKDAIIEAIIKSGGVPGPMLRNLHRVVEKAADKNISKIKKSFLKKILNQAEEIEAEEELKVEISPPTKIDLKGKKQQ